MQLNCISEGFIAVMPGVVVLVPWLYWYHVLNDGARIDV